MENKRSKIETTANIAIIFVAILIGFVVVNKYFINDMSAKPATPMKPKVGSKIDLSDVKNEQNEKTLIIALQKGCHFCTESAPFYKRLGEELKNTKIKMVASLPGDVNESREYLSNLGITGLEIRQSPLAKIQVGGTPTLILLDEKGEVLDSWIGKLPKTKEDEVINKLKM